MATVKAPIDGTRIGLISTGKVHAVPVWKDGTLVQGAQESDPATGLPLWTVDVVIDDGDENARSEAVGVRVPAPSAPVVQRWTPVMFERLSITVRNNKAGGLTSYWSAAGVAQPGPSRRAAGGEG